MQHSIYGSTPIHSSIIKQPLSHPKSTIRIGKEYNWKANNLRCIHLLHFDSVCLSLAAYVTYIIRYYFNLYCL